MGFPLGVANKEEFVRYACEHTPGVKEAGGFEYMKQNGVWHDPNAKPKFFSYKKVLKPEAYMKDTVVFDEETGTYWDWKKAKMKSAEEAMAKGYVHTKKSYGAYVGQRIGATVYSGFKPDKVNKSGYMELYSSLMEEKGLPPLPTWTQAPEHLAMGPKDLILTTFKVGAQIHSRSQNCKWLTEIYHDNPGWINPVTAANLGIANGDAIKVTSSVGAITTQARVTPAVVPGVIAISHHCGHWEYGRYASPSKAPMGAEDGGDHRKWWSKNGVHPNWIIPNAPDPVAGQLRWFDTVVQVVKV